MSDKPERLSFTAEELAALLHKSSNTDKEAKAVLSFDRLLFPIIVVAITSLAGVVFTLSQEMASTKEKIVTLNDSIKDMKSSQARYSDSLQQVSVISQQITNLVSTSSAIQTNLDKLRNEVSLTQSSTNEKFLKYEGSYVTQSDFKSWAEDFKADMKSGLGDLRDRVDEVDRRKR